MADLSDVGMSMGASMLQDVLIQQSALSKLAHKHVFTIPELEAMSDKERMIVSILALQNIQGCIETINTAIQSYLDPSQEEWIRYDLSTQDEYSFLLDYKERQRASIICTVGSPSAVSIMLPGAGSAFSKTLTTGTWYKLPYQPGTRLFQVSGNTFLKGIIHYGDSYLGNDL